MFEETLGLSERIQDRKYSCTLFKLLEVVFDLLVPVVVAKIIDIGIANNDHGYIVKMFLVLILMAAVGLSCSFTAQYFAARASVGCATNLRQAVFDHIQGFSFTELDTIGTDTLITRRPMISTRSRTASTWDFVFF